MKKYYKYGELILILRQEYKECKKLLEELKKYVYVKSDYKNISFSGRQERIDEGLPNDITDARLFLIVERNYSEILKKLISLEQLGCYNNQEAVYLANFDIVKQSNGLYDLKYYDTPFLKDKYKYIPDIEITNQEKFSEIVDQVFSTDLMKSKEGLFSFNSDYISLDFDYACIHTTLGYSSYMVWNGKNDQFWYSVAKESSPCLIEEILSIELPIDKLSPDWIKLIKKHEKLLEKNIIFGVDNTAQSKKGYLNFARIQKTDSRNIVKLKYKKRK